MAKGVNFTFRATNAAKAAMGDFQRGLKGVQKETQRTQALQRSWNRGLNSNRRAVQQFGFQMTDFAVQVSGGQSAMLAFTQQGGQMLQFFGPFGAIAAAVLAVFGSLAIAFTRSGKALSDLTPLAGVTREGFATLGRVLNSVKEIMIDAANVIVNNLDTILISASFVAAFFVGKWVKAFVAARIATLNLASALGTLKEAMIRTGILALVVLAGYLVERFLKLAEVAGGFGQALALVTQIAKESFINMDVTAAALVDALAGAALSIATGFVESFAWIMTQWDVTMNAMGKPFNKLMETVGVGFRVGTSGIGDSLREVADSLRGEATAFYQSSVAGFNQAIPSLQKIRDLVKETKVDIRDWFGGAGTGADAASGAAQKQADRIEDIFKKTQQSISQGMSSSFKSLLDESKSFGEATRDILGSILNNVINILMTPIFNNIAGSLAGGIMGGLGNIGASFDGGGFTGAGVRAGGMDGKGGKLAMVHPNETVVDHTKGQSVGGNTVVFNISTPDVAGFQKSQRQLARQAKAVLG